MGCDIHLAVEVRRSGRWQRVLPPESLRDPWYVEQAAKNPNDEWYARHLRETWYDGRNYRLFGVLADVRNGYGFAGIETGESVRPIAQPRGLPDDVSDEVRALADGEGDGWLGDHSFSWLTLAELQAYEWDNGAMCYGVVPLDQFMDRLSAHGMDVPVRVDQAPYKAWCGATSGPNIATIEAGAAVAALKAGGFVRAVHERTHIRDAWVTSIRSQCRDWCERVMPALAALGAPEDVRIVFGFDS